MKEIPETRYLIPTTKMKRVTVDQETILEGLSKVNEFKKKQQLEVWYSKENNIFRAIKINKMMELGC